MTIRVYQGKGSSHFGAPILIEELSRHLNSDVAGIDEHEMRGSDDWRKNTSLLVFGAKSVGGFKKALGDEVLQHIREGVAQGAFDYMGICAGAALASAKIKYRVEMPQTDKKIIVNEGLSMFNGLASGPARSVTDIPFSGLSGDLSLIWLKSTQDYQPYNSFYWGGPALIPLEKIPEDRGKPLAYLQGDNTPMSLKVKFGQGSVILCSHHPEINAGNVGHWAEIRHLPAPEAYRLEELAKRHDGTAMQRFLSDSGLSPFPQAKKVAGLTATPS